MAEHPYGRAPSVNEGGEALSFSAEEGDFIGKKRVAPGIVEITE